jgi:hypothetical protein
VVFFGCHYSLFGRPRIIELFRVRQIIVRIYFHAYNRIHAGHTRVGGGFTVHESVSTNYFIRHDCSVAQVKHTVVVLQVREGDYLISAI